MDSAFLQLWIILTVILDGRAAWMGDGLLPRTL